MSIGQGNIQVQQKNAAAGGGGISALSPIGATPNANGATISGVNLILQPASGSFGGLVTTAAQVFAGAKTFNDNVTVNVADTSILFSASGIITGSSHYTISSNPSYPGITIGSAGGVSSSLSLRDPAGTFAAISTDGGPLSLFASSNYGVIQFYSIKNSKYIATFDGQNSSYNSIALKGLVSCNETIIISNYKGCFDIDRTYVYAASGNNPHGFTDGTIFRQGNSAFNSFGSFVTFGNTAPTLQDHYAAFQNVWLKDGTNTINKVYGFVNAVSEITGGTITDLYGYYHYSPTITGGTITNQYAIQVPTVTGAANNYGISIGSGSTTFLPLKLTSGSLLTTAIAGGIEFLTDKFYATITTGAARKEITINEAALTPGTTPVATTNGRLVDGLILASGTYTPTLTNGTNVAASTAFDLQYLRVGSVVTVSGKIEIDPTATGTNTVLELTLPIASNFTSDGQAAGSGGEDYGPRLTVSANLTTDLAAIHLLPTSLGNSIYYFTFTYLIL